MCYIVFSYFDPLTGCISYVSLIWIGKQASAYLHSFTIPAAIISQSLTTCRHSATEFILDKLSLQPKTKQLEQKSKSIV